MASTQAILGSVKKHVVAAIEEQYSTGSDETQIIAALAKAAVMRSLTACPAGFELQPAPLESVGHITKSIKDSTKYSSTKLQRLIQTSEFCQGLFSFGPTVSGGHKTLVVHLQAVIPDANQDIKALLPTVPWHNQAADVCRLCIAAIQKEYPASAATDESKLIVALAEACITTSLTEQPGGFLVHPTPFPQLGAAVKAVRDSTKYAKLMLGRVTKSDFCTGLFTFDAYCKGQPTLRIHLPAVIPHASAELRACFPADEWPQQLPQPAIKPLHSGTMTHLAVPQSQSAAKPTEAPQDAATHRQPLTELSPHRYSDKQSLGQSLQTAVKPLQPACLAASLRMLLPDEVTTDDIQEQADAESSSHSPPCSQSSSDSSAISAVIARIADEEADSTASAASDASVSGHHSALAAASSSSPASTASAPVAPHGAASSSSPASSTLSPFAALEAGTLPIRTIASADSLTAYKLSQPSASRDSARFTTIIVQDAAQSDAPDMSASAAAMMGSPGQSPSGAEAQSVLLDADPVQSMLQLLPQHLADVIQEKLDEHKHNGQVRTLSDIIADLGRPVRLRYCSSPDFATKEEVVACSLDIQEALAHITAIRATQQSGPVAEPFLTSSRIGVNGTLHRISAMTNSCREVYGLTYRIGRHLPDAAQHLTDVVSKIAQGNGSGSLLLLGPPGAGKTTLLRDITCQLADRFSKLVMVVDPSEEIAGGGNTPHACIGSARRMLGSHQQSKYEVLQEAVANHGPEIIVVDEIGCAKEVAAIRDIAQRGVAVVATAHGTNLQRWLENPVLSSLLGGKQTMVIADFAARFCAGRKTKQERSGVPTFSMLVEIDGQDNYVVHTDLAASIDSLLQGRQATSELRTGQHLSV